MRLPVLQAAVERRLSLELDNLLNQRGFTGKHLEWADRARARCRRINAQSGPGSSWSDPDDAADHVCIEETVRFAVDYCSMLEKEYWKAWLISSAPYEEYVSQLEDLSVKSDECAERVWEGRIGWYQGSCRSRVSAELSRFVAERVIAARTAEIDRLTDHARRAHSAQDGAALKLLLFSTPAVGSMETSANHSLTLHPEIESGAASSVRSDGTNIEAELSRFVADSDSSEGAEPVKSETDHERAARRKAFIDPLLKNQSLGSVYAWASRCARNDDTAIDPHTVYNYYEGRTKSLRTPTREALSKPLGIGESELPA